MEKKIDFDKYYYKALAQVLTELRQKSGRTYDEVAYMFDLIPATFYRYESGSRKCPATLFVKLCKLYNVKVEDVLKQVNEIATNEMLEAYKNAK